MVEVMIKRRMRRAINAVVKHLNYPPGNCEIIILSNHVFHLEAIRKKEIRKIRVVLDEITKEDLTAVKNFELPENCTKEIWCRKLDGNFLIKKITE